MKNRNLVLGGVAGFIVGAMLGVPASAQSLSRESTPAERAATERLNRQQATAPPTVLRATVAPSNQFAADANAYNQALAEHNASVFEYNAAVAQQNREAQAEYKAQLDEYGRQLEAYKNQPAPVVIVDTPERVLAYPGDNRVLVQLGSLADPDDELGGVPVEDRAGYVVGHFRHMTFQDEGVPEGVITLHNNKTVAVDEDHLRYDTDHDTVVADLSFDELNRMPARF